MKPLSILRSFLSDRTANVAIIAAIVLPMMLGFTALVGEIGYSLLREVENQRVADEAAYAAALAYDSTSSNSTMVSVAQNVGVLNGLPATAVSASLVTSPRTPASQAVFVTVQTTAPLFLAPVLHFGNSMPVSARSYAQLGATAPACVIALNPALSGVALTGGTSIQAPNCAVASNNSVSVPCGDTISSELINYNGAAPTQPCGGITGPIAKANTPDPLASVAGVIAASARARADGSLVAPTIAAVPSAPNITFDYSNSAVAVAQAAGCTASYSSGVWTVTCPSGGTYKFGTLSLGGGITVKFNVNGSASTTYDFSGEINDNGSSLAFGPGTFNVANGIRSGGGSVTTFGAGSFNIGRDTATCNGAGYYSICNTGSSMTFGGPSTFVVASGIYNNGGSTLTLGSGTTNSFNIGPASDGNATNFGGGSTTSFADATGAGDIFQVVGNLYEGGGACTTFSAASNHDIDGNINLAGGLSLGAGLYAISGYFTLGALSGGDVYCQSVGANVGLSGTNVTIAIAATASYSDYSGNTDGLYIGAGFSHISIVAPTSGTYANLAVIGPTTTSNTSGAQLTGGAFATSFGGAFYFPNGPLGLNGGASMGNVAGSCFTIIASQITLAGGTSAKASACSNSAVAQSTPLLVQ
jgi:hypothetical protein